MRLHQPTGILLLLWPGWWSIALATPEKGGPDAFLLGIFALGAIVMRAAGCIVNDWWDKDFDRQVTRTRQRPLASGQVSTRQAFALLAVLLAMGLILLLQLNGLTQILGVLSLIPVAVYPLMKRWIPWPQAFLGLTFNWGALMGWTAVTGGFAWPMLWLYAAGFFWTMAYDTIYALQDKEDDIRIGIKSTAISFGADIRIAVLACFIVCLMALGIAGVLAGGGRFYFAGLAVMGLLFLRQLHTLSPDAPSEAMAKFNMNGIAGAALFAGIVLGK